MNGPKKGSRGRAPSRNTARGRDGQTRDTSRPARELATDSTPETETRRYGVKKPQPRLGSGKAPQFKRTLPDLKKVQLPSVAPETEFVDRDGEKLTFPDSNLKRLAAQILSTRARRWRYRPFTFPLFSDRGHEQSFSFDFYIYDAEDSVIRLILVVPHESREVWDKVGRFKRQFPMYRYELWTPEKLAQLLKPRSQLGF